MSFSSIVLFGVLVSFAAAQDPFFIVQHNGALLSSRLDNIINPGAVSSHQHAIIGGSNFGPDYDYANSLQANCTTGNLDNDHSNYWTPDLYRKQPGGKFKHIGLSYARTSTGEAIHEFPAGFRMMAGDATRTTYDEAISSNAAIQYVCLGGQGNNKTPDFPKQRCPMGLRADLFFPNCWDGKNNWLEGNKHVAYPAVGPHDGGGKCPDTHPKRIMSVFYEFIFHDDDVYEPGQRVLATGDDIGYSLHGDWTNGWPQGFFSEVLSYGAKCSVGDSVENCPATLKHMKKPNPKCPYNGIVVDEDWGKDNLIDALPGNNPVYGSTGAKVPKPDYVEKGLFVRVGDMSNKITPTGPGKPYAQINAGDYLIAKVGTDAAIAGPTSISGNGATVGVGAAETPVSSSGPTEVSASSSSSRPIKSASQSASVSSAGLSTANATIPGQVLLASNSAATPAAEISGSANDERVMSCKWSRKRRNLA